MSANRVFQLWYMGRLNKLGCLGHRSIITLSNICSGTILKVVKHYSGVLLARLLADVSRSKRFQQALMRPYATYPCHEQCKKKHAQALEESWSGKSKLHSLLTQFIQGVGNILRDNWNCSESEHLNINHDILCYPSRLMSLKYFNKRHITLAFYESQTNLVSCQNRGTVDFVRGAVLGKLLTWYTWRKEVCCCLSKIFLWFVPRAASLSLSASVANPKKLFYVRKIQLFSFQMLW